MQTSSKNYRKHLSGIVLSFTLSGCALSNVDLTGDWVIQSSVGGEIPITVYCSLIQTGQALSGTCTPEMENAESSELTGSVDGNSASWGYDVVFNGNPGTVRFDADTFSNSAMSGILNLSGTEAEFTALRPE